ncbi:hypothetical protein BGZ80_009958 [Entomortierella chlamydospora]|uniref:Uncharacterized protein n=1 Tax=Entomortierella chlamydospora TaxID=101097 RepID=A0A9P6MVJ5_9FUNG|nr:hypothetical protein BGZ79_009067 [Entomortierella chlamydospora]KAG0015244.1 hypothetical protein BGZ80_009958 [Entomortierella chlamydospora]
MIPITINVKASNDQRYVISISLTETVLQLKLKVTENCDTPAERMRLIYSGRVLKDADLLETYKIVDGNTVHMVRSVSPPVTTASNSSNSTVPATNPTTTTPAASITHASTVSQDPTTPNSGALPNPWSNLMTAGRGAGGFGGMGNIGGMESAAMMQMMQDPNFAQYMSSMLQNPQVLESMISMNPALRSMEQEARQMIRSQQFQRMISNPDTLRHIAQTGPQLGGGAGGMSPFGGMFNPWGNATPTSTSPPSFGATNTASPRAAASGPAFNPFVALGGAGATNPITNYWAQQMAAMGLRAGATTTTASNQTQQSPEERFQVQLKQLNEMGFWDPSKNIRALLAAGGNVNSAIELLFTGSV